MKLTLRFFIYSIVFIALNKVHAFHKKSSCLSNIKQKKKAADDTKFLQSLIDKASPGDTVVFPKGTYYVHTLKLRDGVHIRSKGLLQQLPLDSLEEYGQKRQRSNSPLFYGKGVHGINLSFHAKTLQEALILESCSGIRILDTHLEGDSTKLRSFSGIYIYKSDSIIVEHSDIAYYGLQRMDVKKYQPGTGIRIQSSNRLKLIANTIHHNGENGLFFHSCRDVIVDHNEIDHNGMSGVQIAFGRAGIERNYRLTHNHLHDNAADAIDINNPNTSRPIQLDALIQDNASANNGWVKGESTPDGSGIATLVGLQQVVVKNNKSIKSNRPAIYMRNCDQIEAIENEADNVTEIVGNLGTIRLYKNTMPGLRLLSSVRAKKLTIDSNTIRHLSFPNGISVDSLVLLANDLKGNINVNMNGKLVFKRNKLSSTSDKGGMSLWKVNEAILSDNEIHTTISQAVSINPKAENVLIQQNKIVSAKTCIVDEGSYRLKIVQNTLASQTKGGNLESIISTHPNELYFENNEYYIGGEKKEYTAFTAPKP